MTNFDDKTSLRPWNNNHWKWLIWQSNWSFGIMGLRFIFRGKAVLPVNMPWEAQKNFWYLPTYLSFSGEFSYKREMFSISSRQLSVMGIFVSNQWSLNQTFDWTVNAPADCIPNLTGASLRHLGRHAPSRATDKSMDKLTIRSIKCQPLDISLANDWCKWLYLIDSLSYRYFIASMTSLILSYSDAYWTNIW